MGLNNSSLISVHYFMLFVGDLMFIVSCVEPQWIILEQRRNQLPFDGSMCFINIYFPLISSSSLKVYDDVLDWRMFRDTDVKSLSQHTADANAAT